MVWRDPPNFRPTSRAERGRSATGRLRVRACGRSGEGVERPDIAEVLFPSIFAAPEFPGRLPGMHFDFITPIWRLARFRVKRDPPPVRTHATYVVRSLNAKAAPSDPGNRSC